MACSSKRPGMKLFTTMLVPTNTYPSPASPAVTVHGPLSRVEQDCAQPDSPLPNELLQTREALL
jgi:hypothetical protein